MVHFADSEFPQELLVRIVCLLPNWHDKWQLSLTNAVIKRGVEKAITVREVDAVTEKIPLKGSISYLFAKKMRILSIENSTISKAVIKKITVAASQKNRLEVLVPQGVFSLFERNFVQLNMIDSNLQLEAVYDSDEEEQAEEREEQEGQAEELALFHKRKEDDYQKTNAVAISLEEIKADKELVAQRLGEEYVECVIFFSKFKLMVTSFDEFVYSPGSTIKSCTIAISKLKMEDGDSSNTFVQLCAQSKATGKWKLPQISYQSINHYPFYHNFFYSKPLDITATLVKRK